MGQCPIRGARRASGKKKFLTLSVYDLKLKKQTTSLFVYIDFLWNFFF
jgi:hypothetical protein